MIFESVSIFSINNFNPIHVNPLLKADYPQHFSEAKSRGGRLAIGWQATAPAGQPICIGRHAIFASKTLWIIGIKKNLSKPLQTMREFKP